MSIPADAPAFNKVQLLQLGSQAWQVLTQGQPPHGVFAIYDGARRSPGLYRDLSDSGLPHECLFGGQIVSPLLEAAPWCVHLGFHEAKGREFFCRNWGSAAGIYLTALPNAELKAVRAQLKRLLRVQLPSGSKALFRFYDPRVFRVFAPTCDTAQWRLLASDHHNWWCESEDAAQLLQYYAQADVALAVGHDLG